MMSQYLKRAPNIITTVTTVTSKVKFPEKFKGTIIDKWADYWKNLYIDYQQMLQDLRSDIQDNPRKAFLWAASLSGIYALSKNNPSEIDFKDELKKIANDVALVSEDCRNPTSLEHLNYLDRCYNQGVIHYRNFGIASVMYVSDVNDACDLYKAHCKYLKPTYLSLPSKVIDVGFMGKWWNMYIKTTNYDINL